MLASGDDCHILIPVVHFFEQMKIRSGNRSLERDNKIEARPHTRKMLPQVIDFYRVILRQEVGPGRVDVYTFQATPLSSR